MFSKQIGFTKFPFVNAAVRMQPVSICIDFASCDYIFIPK